MQGEKVLVVKRTDLFGLNDERAFQGMVGVDKIDTRMLMAPHAEYRDRAEMEADPTFKQIIPYCVLLCHGCLFYYTRGKGQGEHRLHDKVSVGIGGHLNPIDDVDAKDPSFLKGMIRELTEEVDIHGGYRHQVLGYINDDSNEVGRVHLGVVNLFELDAMLAFSKEKDMDPSGFCLLVDLKGIEDRLENWSKMVVDYGLRQGWHHPGTKIRQPENVPVNITNTQVGYHRSGSWDIPAQRTTGWIDIDPQMIVDLFKHRDHGIHAKVVKDALPDGAKIDSIHSQLDGSWRFRLTGVEPRQYSPQIEESKYDPPVKNPLQ